MTVPIFSYHKTSKTIRLIMLLIAVFLLSAFLLIPENEEVAFSLIGKKSSKEDANYPNLGQLIQTPNRIMKFSLPDLRDELEVYIQEKRPDFQVKEKEYVIQLKSTGQKILVKSGTPIFLNLDFQEHLCFSKEKTSFWMEVYPIDNEQLKVDVVLQNENLPVKIEPNQTSFFLRIKRSVLAETSDLKNFSYFRSLAAAKWWGIDQYKAIYHPGKALKHRIEIDGEYILEVQENDTLVWDGEIWRAAEGKNDSLNNPVAFVKRLNTKILELQGWDKEGKEYLFFALLPLSAAPIRNNLEEIFSQIRIRTLKQVSCMIERERMVLHKGDWIMHTLGKWKILRTLKEKEIFINYLSDSELFIFDGIESKSGEKLFKGHFFNGMRTQALDVNISFHNSGSSAKMHMPSRVKSSSLRPSSEASSIHKSLLKLPKLRKGRKK